ncbi:hypothetical protein QC764_210310 [Podospora pseudoanserina]|uniref:ZZ-type domain-containing protein n=1 Tax=Podospora pseudoanserina TaxID=2609844 RepID=A0ABR0IIY5_9PEZI|nr:hypothetical protein QC764_210310 [Podospora pseudoanserina]
MAASLSLPSQPFRPPSPPPSTPQSSPSLPPHLVSANLHSSEVQQKSSTLDQDVEKLECEETLSAEGPQYWQDNFQARQMQHSGHNVHSNSNMGYQRIGVMNLVTKDHRTGAQPNDPDFLADKQPLDWLSKFDHRTAHERALESRTEGTVSWLLNLDAFKKWKVCPKSFLWLHGKHFCGKTILCASIIEELEQEATDGVPIVAYYYLDPNEFCTKPSEGESRQESFPERLLRSWLRQLCEGLSQLPKGVQKVRQEFKKTGSLDYTLLKYAIRCLTEERGQVYLVIDGLDSLTESPNGKDSLAVLFELLECLKSHDPVHILVVSRDHVDTALEDRCWDLSHDREGGFDIAVEGTAHTNGIELMVDQELKKSNWGIIRRKHPEWIEIIKKNLVDNSDGIFGLVKLRLLDPEFHELIRRRDPAPDEEEVLDALNEIPKEINAFYDKALERICVMPNAYLSLQWLMCTLRPLRFVEFEDLINWGQTNKKNSVSIRHSFGSLVAFPESPDRDGKQIVDFAFSSLEEYLVNKADRCGGLAVVHLMMANQCLEYINECVVNTDDHTLHESDEDEVDGGKVLECDLQRRPLLEYAINNWYRHVLEYLESRQDSELVLESVPDNGTQGILLTWLHRIYNYWGTPLRNIFHKKPQTPSALDFSEGVSASSEFAQWVSSTRRLVDDLDRDVEQVHNDLKAAAYKCFELMVDLLIQHQAPTETEATTHTPLQAACMCEFNLLIYSLLHGHIHNSNIPHCKVKNSDIPKTGRTEQIKARPDPCHSWWPDSDGTKEKTADYDGKRMVRALLLAGADVNKPSSHGDTALHHAMAKGNLAAVTLLLQRNADMEICATGPLNVFLKTVFQAHDSEVTSELEWPMPMICCGTPLLWGIQMGQHDAVEFLLDQGAEFKNLAPVSGHTALHAAAYLSDQRMARLALDIGCRVNDCEANGFSALHFAVYQNNLGVVELLLANGADVNILANCGYPPLMWARHINIVRVLLRNGADWNAPPDKPHTVLTVAAFNGYHEIVRMLLEKGAPASSAALRYATCEGHTEVVQVLVDFDIPVDIFLHAKLGITALPLAAGGGHSDIATILLRKGASLYNKHPVLGSILNAASFGGEDIVFDACWQQEPSMRHEKDAYGRTALYFAALGGQDKMVGKLLKLGYKANAKDNHGRNALHAAASGGSLYVVEKLLEQHPEVDPTETDDDGWTALHWAAKAGEKKVVEKLRGVCLREGRMPDDNKWPPARIAIYHGHRDLLPLLERKQTGENVFPQSEWHWWSAGVMHKDYVCDSCLRLIHGIRFHCRTCYHDLPFSNYCFKCEGRGKRLHPGHRFEEIRPPYDQENSG